MANEYGIDNSARNTGDKIGAAVGDIADDTARRVRSKVNQAADSMQKTAGAMADELNGFGDQIAATVKEQPLASLLIAGGVGLMLGFLLRR